MDLQVEDHVKEERHAALLEELYEQARAFNRTTLGKRVGVLFTRGGKHDGQALGYSPYMQPVHVMNGDRFIGRMAEVDITGATATSLTGELVTSEALV
jgi:tRNA-2-methylthio-N6-dimethylallyladenosine synthase